MALGYKTFGPCVPQANVGTSDAFVAFGVCTDGGRIDFQPKERDLKSDAGGDAAVEIQNMGLEATIEMELTSWDDTYLDKLIAAANAQTAAGTLGVPGALLGTGGFLKGLYLPSSTMLPWYFRAVKLVPHGGKFGTEHTKRRLRFRAIPYIAGTATTTSGTTLYTNSAPP